MQSARCAARQWSRPGAFASRGIAIGAGSAVFALSRASRIDPLAALRTA